MEKERISYHESVQKMYEKIKQDNMTNVWDRYEAQGLGETRISGVCSVWAESAVIFVPTVPAGQMPQKTKEGSAGLPPTAWQ